MSKFLGTVNINTGPGGDEGGEIVLAPASTNTTLSGNVVLDIYQNKLRIFESGGSNRGAYIDLSSASTGVGSNLLAGGGGATNLDGLTDVTITAPEEFQSLVYNGTTWVNGHASTVTYVRNAESTTLTTGTVVYLFGATGDHASVKRADNDSDTTSSKTIGLVAANIAANENGPVVTRGYVDGIDLSSGYAAGDILWLAEDGGFTKTKPSAPEHLVFIGVVVRATNNGIVYVATQNGYELDELHNVQASSPNSGDFLKYNGSLWVNDTIDLGTDTTGSYVASLVAGTGVTLSNNSGEGATPTIAIGQSVGTTSNVTFGSVTAGGVTAGVVGSTTISTDSGDLTISPASQTVVIGNNINVNNGSVFTGSIDGSTGGLNYITLFTNSGNIDIYGATSIYGTFTANQNATFNNPITVEAIREKIIASSIIAGVLTVDYNNSSIAYQSVAPSANFTINVTNLPTDNNNAITVSVFVQQGATGYIPNALQIAGVGQTIRWAGGTTPTPTSSSGKIDLFTFTLIRRSSAWTVLGSANLNY